MGEAGDLIDAALHEDDVRVLRHRIECDYATSDVPSDAFQEMQIEIPLRGEEVHVHKRPVVREEVIVSKMLRERTLVVTETLSREELRIDDDYIDDELRDMRLERGRIGRSV